MPFVVSKLPPWPDQSLPATDFKWIIMPKLIQAVTWAKRVLPKIAA
jgi:hypothetical protein